MIFQFIIFTFSLVFLEIFVRFVARLGFIDTPNERSNHAITTPSSAGVPVFIAIALSSVFFGSDIFHNYIPNFHAGISTTNNGNFLLTIEKTVTGSTRRNYVF